MRDATRKSCFCNHCERPFARAELNGRFLCATCRTMPGVHGYRDPLKRGREASVHLRHPEDYNRLVHVVTGDEPATTPARSPRRRPPSAWQRYQDAVLAQPDLTADDKLFFVGLVRCADYATGTNCAPKLTDVAVSVGKTPRWASRRLQRLKTHGLVETIPLRSRQGGWAQNLYRFTGHGFDCKVTCGKMPWLAPSATPRPAGNGFGGRRPRHQHVVSS